MIQSRQLAAIMFTDIVGYTALMGRDEQKAFEYLDKNRQIQKPIIEQHGGHWIKEIGDGVLASFTTVSDAVAAAIKIQETCNAAREFQLRIGIHLGEVVFENGDVFGDGVNVASRIQGKAPPGGIWISEAVHNNVVNKHDIVTKYVTTERLKNVKDPVRIYQVVAEGVQPVKSKIPLIKSKGNSKTLVAILGVIVLLAGAYFIYQNFAGAGNKTDSVSEEAIDKSIAVLPFEDLSQEKDQAWLGEGIAEEIINSITAINDLKVIGRTSSFQFKGKNMDAKAIGEKLNVGSVLEGSIQRSGDEVRIIAKLVRVKDNFSIWSQRFEKKLQDIFAIQDTIAQNIVEKLKLTLSASEKPRLVKQESDPEAYTQYLRGLFIYKQEKYAECLEYFLRAVQLDSGFAAPYSYIALAKTWVIYRSQNFSDLNAITEAKRYANKAINLDPNIAEGYSALALLAWTIELDFHSAKVNFEKSVQLNPSASLIKNRYGYFLLWMADLDKAKKLALDAINSDPADYNGYFIASSASLYKKDFGEAAKYISEGQRLFPGWRAFQNLNCLNKFYSGAYDEAIGSINSLLKGDSVIGDDHLTGLLSIAYLKKGNLTESNRVMQLLKNRPTGKNSNVNYSLARVFLQHDMKDSCFRRLETSLIKRESDFKLLKIDPLFETIRSDERYQQLYRRYGFDKYD